MFRFFLWDLSLKQVVQFSFFIFCLPGLFYGWESNQMLELDETSKPAFSHWLLFSSSIIPSSMSTSYQTHRKGCLKITHSWNSSERNFFKSLFFVYISDSLLQGRATAVKNVKPQFFSIYFKSPNYLLRQKNLVPFQLLNVTYRMRKLTVDEEMKRKKKRLEIQFGAWSKRNCWKFETAEI